MSEARPPSSECGRPRNMLVVAHEATLTGAPMNLLHFVRWMAANTNCDVHVLVLRDGPLRHQFEQVVPTTVLDRTALQRTLGLAHNGMTALGSSRARIPLAAAWLRPQLRGLGAFDAVYLNSVTSVSVLPYLQGDPTVIAHVHELDVALSIWRPQSDRDLFVTRPHRYIAASQAVSDALVRVCSIDPATISVHYEFIDTQPFAQYRLGLRQSERIRRRHRIPADASIVVGAGTIDWRKGADLFVQLASELARQTRDPVYCVWIGGDLTTVEMVRLHADMRRAGTENVLFAGVQPDPREYFALADVFVLTSREDPFPLVCLEHAAMGHPIVTYRNGGIPELLEASGPDAAQGIVDYLDVAAMANRIVELLGSSELSAAAGRQVRDRVTAAHDVSVAAPRLWSTVQATCGAPRR